jgi:hypothetical protein
MLPQRTKFVLNRIHRRESVDEAWDMIRAAHVRAARKRYRQIAPVLNEQCRRRFVALEAQRLGRGGVSAMARITDLARSTIYHGLSDIRNNVTTPP